MTDNTLGNAERLIDSHGEDILFCHDWNRWLIWDKRRYKTDGADQIRKIAAYRARAIHAEAADQSISREYADSLAKHAKSSESAKSVNAAISLAAVLVPVESKELDRDKWLLNVRNGTLNLKTGELLAHDRANRITKLVDVDYDPAATAPTWESFLHRIMDGDSDMVAFLKRAWGYSLTGNTRERKIFIPWGTGKNGKSTALGTIRAILGEFALNTPTETLLVKRDGAIPNDVARLQGVRFVTAIETEEGRRLAESSIKALTGNDELTARFMRGEFFDFFPECKVWLATNHKPVIRGTDDAIWDRIALIPFTVRIPEAEQDKTLPDKLLEESPGILRWLVDGCLEWQRDGLNPPQKVHAATKEYRADSDVLSQFLDECCIENYAAKVTVAALYAEYLKWGATRKIRPIQQKVMSASLIERGFSRKRYGRRQDWHFFGIGLAADVANVANVANVEEESAGELVTHGLRSHRRVGAVDGRL